MAKPVLESMSISLYGLIEVTAQVTGGDARCLYTRCEGPYFCPSPAALPGRSHP